MPPLNSAVMAAQDYRRKYLATLGLYSGVVHGSFVMAVCGAVIGFTVSRISEPSLLEWLTVPSTFIFANLFEYSVHRGPMHHRIPGFKFIFERHAVEHHRYYNHESMAFESERDLKMVFFPAAACLVITLGSLGLGWALGLLTSPNIGWFYAVTAVAYYFNYEILHFAYHTPLHWTRWLPGMSLLRRLHTTHHDPSQMSRFNFNITYPIADWVFGSLSRR